MKHSIFLLLLVLAASSCTKSEDPPTVVTPQPTDDPSLPIAGQLQMDYTETSDGAPPYMTASTLFYKRAGDPRSGWLPAGTVSANSMVLTQLSINTYWSNDTANLAPFHNVPCNWSVSGSSSVTGFSYTDGQPFPQDANVLPQQISRSTDLVLQFPASQYTNTDTILFGLGDTQVGLDCKVVPGGSATIPKSYLDSLQGNSGLFWISAQNYQGTVLNGKRYIFCKTTQRILNVTLN